MAIHSEAVSTPMMIRAAVEPTIVNALPQRSTAAGTVWDRAIELRDGFAGAMRAALQQDQIEALVLVSQNGIYPPWVKLEAWMPVRSSAKGTRQRNELIFVIEAKPYRRAPLVVTAQLSTGRRTYTINASARFPLDQVAAWVRFATGRAGRPPNYHPFRDRLLRLIAELIPGLDAPGHNPLQPEYRGSWFTLTRLLGAASLLGLLAGMALLGGESGGGSLLVFLGLGGLLANAIIIYGRRRVVFDCAQPTTSPRDTMLVDSWHAVIAEIGAEFAAIKQRLVDRIAAGLGEIGIACETESYSFRTPTGCETRERLVVSKGQSIVHVHIYLFGEDVFVGWDAHLNWAKWDEAKLASVRKKGDVEVEYRELRPALYIPNQFDMMDMNSLSDLVHRRLEDEIKIILKEKAIDQEIDFRIIRGDRDAALDRAKHDGKAKKNSGWRRRVAPAG